MLQPARVTLRDTAPWLRLRWCSQGLWVQCGDHPGGGRQAHPSPSPPSRAEQPRCLSPQPGLPLAGRRGRSTGRLGTGVAGSTWLPAPPAQPDELWQRGRQSSPSPAPGAERAAPPPLPPRPPEERSQAERS